jgi:hypothetical protein
MRIGLTGPSYTLQTPAAADEECINLFPQTIESQAAIVPYGAYGGKNAAGLKVQLHTPGLSVFCTFPESPVRGVIPALGRAFAVVGQSLYEVSSAGVPVNRGFVDSDGRAASLAFNQLQLLIVSAGRAFCFTLATNVLLEVTSQLAGIPVRVDESDTYFIVCFENSNKFQISQVLDGTTWPGQLVNEVSVFAGNIRSLIINHRELWVFGSKRSQPYQDTGSTEVFDVIPGALIEKGCAALNPPCLIDNSVFWIDEDARGGRMAWRSNGYTPQRVSTYAVEVDLATYASVADMVTYSYQDQGHMFWVLYIPGSQWSWVYDVTESLWHKRAEWNEATSIWGPHFSWNHMYAFDMHLVGDWNSGNLYQMGMSNVTDNGVNIRRLRRSPTISDEMARIFHAELVLDFDTGQGPQPPLLDGLGNPRPPQCMLRWSDDRGRTWSNEHILGCGSAGQYRARAIKYRLGQSRYRVYEVSMTDPIQWCLVDGYLKTEPEAA